MSYQPGQPPPPEWTPPPSAPPAWQSPGAADAPSWQSPGEAPPAWQSPSPAAPASYGSAPGAARPSAGWQAAPKPGITPLRPLGVGEILDGAFAALRQYPRATLGVCAVAAVVSGVTSFLLQVLTRNAPIDSGVHGLTTVVSLFVAVVVWALVSGVLSVVIGDAVLGRPVVLGQAWRQIRPRVGAIIGASVLVAVLIVVGFVFFILPSIYVAVALIFTTPVLVLEGRGVVESLKRSRELVSGSWWRTFAILFLAAIICYFMAVMLVFAFAAVAGGSVLSIFDLSGTGSAGVGLIALAVITLGSMVASTIVAAIMGGVVVLLYLDRRMRREGLDVALAQAATRPPQPHPGM